MEQWRIDSSGISKHDSQEQELFLYQHMRTQNGKIFYLKEHLQILNNSSLDLFDKPISLTEKTVCNACEELLYRGGYSSQAIHIVELRVWQSGKFAMRVIETSLYKGFALRVMRPKATVIEHCNYPFSQPTSAAIAMTDFLRLMALKNQCQVAICTDKNMVITAVDGATPIVVHGTAITIKSAPYNAAANRTETRKEILALKSKGINTLKPDYPQPIWFYELCDKIGIYVVERAAINPTDNSTDRTIGGTPSNNPQLLGEYLDRVKGMYYRTRNYSCIIAYTLGGEKAGNGYCMYKAYQWLKSVEKQRPVVCLSADGEWNSDPLSL